MNVYEIPFERLFDGPEQENEDPLAFVNQFDSIPGSDLLEVAQLLGDSIVSIQNFAPSRQSISKGNELGVRLHVAEQPVAWIPRILAPINVIMYPFAQTSEELKNAFFDDEYSELFSWSGDQPTAHIPTGWTATVHEKGEITQISETSHLITPEQRIIIQKGEKTFVAQRIARPNKQFFASLRDIETGTVALFSMITIACTLSFLLYSYAQGLYFPEPPVNIQEIEEKIVSVKLDQPKEEPKEKPKPKPKPEIKQRPKPKPTKKKPRTFDFKEIEKDKKPQKTSIQRGTKSKKKLNRVRLIGAKATAMNTVTSASTGGYSEGTGSTGGGGGEEGGLQDAVSFSSVSKQARLKKRPPLSIPDEVKEQGIEGTVRIVIDIDETGRVAAARIKKSLHPAADKACVESWKKAIFQPAEQDNEPVGVRNFPRRCRFSSMD